MRNRTLFVIGLLTAAVIAAGVAGLIYWFVQNPVVAGPIAGVIGVIAAAVLQRRWEKRQELERLRRDQRSSSEMARGFR